MYEEARRHIGSIAAILTNAPMECPYLAGLLLRHLDAALEGFRVERRDDDEYGEPTSHTEDWQYVGRAIEAVASMLSTLSGGPGVRSFTRSATGGDLTHHFAETVMLVVKRARERGLVGEVPEQDANRLRKALKDAEERLSMSCVEPDPDCGCAGCCYAEEVMTRD